MKKILTAIPLAVAIMTGGTRGTNAQGITVDAVKSQADGASFIRPNLEYNIPGGLKGFTFMEVYSNGDNYFGKTVLKRKVGSRFSATGEWVYGSKIEDSVGTGLSYSVPLPKGSELDVKALPLWAGHEVFGKKIMTGYSGSVKLPRGFEASSFGEFNARNGEWGYGEVSLGKTWKSGKFGIYYNPLLKNQGREKPVPKLRPRVEHAVRVSYSIR